jgi:hypothetical protein
MRMNEYITDDIVMCYVYMRYQGLITFYVVVGGHGGIEDGGRGLTCALFSVSASLVTLRALWSNPLTAHQCSGTAWPPGLLF